MHLLLPLASSLLYVVAALFLKQSATQGIDPWRTAVFCNTVTAVLFLALWPLGGEIPSIESLYEPLIVGFLFVAAQLFTFLALQKGDVSVATPVLGSKVILVAFFTTVILGQQVAAALWLAAVFSCAGIAFLNRSGKSGHHHVVRTIWFALSAAAGYALFDVLVMEWSPRWGAGRFLPLTMLAGGVLSLVFVPLFPKRANSCAPVLRSRPLLLGALFIALQSIIIVYALAIFGDATAVNVIYSTRGLWSVLAVWWLGHWFANREREQGAATMRTRLAGAALLSAAVVLVFV